MNMIGITERGDAGIDFSWEDALKNKSIDGAVLITKKLSFQFIERVVELQKEGYQVIVHAAITGWGGTRLEPNVCSYKESVSLLCSLIQAGYRKENCVLRIDPVFPTKNGVKRLEDVISYTADMALFPMRVRISVLDEYNHVKERFRKSGFHPIYGEAFQADTEQINTLAQALVRIALKYQIVFECCAETKLIQEVERVKNSLGITQDICIAAGCISEKELKLMGIGDETYTKNPQNRSGCLCLSCKKELLKNKSRCPNGCLYCYWKD